MADQKRWWKFWCTAPSDELVQRLPPAHRWAWAVLGTYTKAHGDNGRVTISESNMVLAAEMGLACCDMICVIKTFPHIVIEEVKNRHGEFTVTWQNWVKYQEDSTQAERAKASRSKRRGEEKRREETRRERNTLVGQAPLGSMNGYKETAEEILAWLNQKACRNYRASDTNLKFIVDRLKGGIQSWQLKAIVSRKVAQWKGTEQDIYLRPATLFNKTKCEQYVGELPKEDANGVS